MSTAPTIGPATAGFSLCGSRAIQVWVALAGRAHAQPAVHGHGGKWSVGQLAAACGCSRNTAGGALSELVDLAWLQVQPTRNAQGRADGMQYRLLQPPRELADAAIERYLGQVASKRKRAKQDEERLLSAVPEAAREDVARVLAGEERLAQLQRGVEQINERADALLRVVGAA